MEGGSEQVRSTDIVLKRLGEPDRTVRYAHGQALLFHLGNEKIWRSELEPGWNWDEDLKPYAEGATSCPLTHREYVVSGRIRYLMSNGTEVEGAAGDVLFVPPGHRSWVLGDEICILIDW